MPNLKETAEWKARYSNYTDDQLPVEKHSHTENAEQHVATVQLLHERQAEANARSSRGKLFDF